MYSSFDQMPDTARIWVYHADRKLNPEEQDWIRQRLQEFCGQWNTHGALMPSSFDIRFDQVIILAVDESKLGASGCSIDSSVRMLKEIELNLGINLLDQGKVSFLSSENEIQTSSSLAIKSKVAEGVLTAETVILNPQVNRKSDLEKKWLIPAKESWLNKYFAN